MQEKQAGTIGNFEIGARENPYIDQGFSAEKTARANAHFESRLFDRLSNSPRFAYYTEWPPKNQDIPGFSSRIPSCLSGHTKDILQNVNI